MNRFRRCLLSAPERPNILWLTVEDIDPYLGAYGHPNAHTPHLDRLAEQGIRYTRVYANAPVCAVARSALLTGMHSPAIGTHQMRSRPRLPASVPAYPKLFRRAGYYCSNNAKTDYNSSYEGDDSLWDASSGQAHYRNRANGQPFFAVFNNTQSHESQLDRFPPDFPTRVDPAEIELPPFHPDLPEMRRAWARLHELITRVDDWVGTMLRELEAEGEAENTIVVFYSDHGGMLAGTKRYLSRALVDGRHFFVRHFMPHRPPGRDTVYGYTVQANWRAWMIEIRDVGLIPEPLFYELVGPDKAFATLYEYAQSDAYPVQRVLAAAKSAGLAQRIVTDALERWSERAVVD